MIRAFFLIVMFASSLSVFSQRYLFYLHGRIIEDQGPDAVDTIRGFGPYQYRAILDSLRERGFVVISEVRQKNTDVEQYAGKVKAQIDSLLYAGIAPVNITVVGSSKGAAIAMLISSLLRNRNINFVFIAGCNEDNFKRLPAIEFWGNILSLYERTDDIGKSCSSVRNRSSEGISHYKEIELNTGLKHGFLYRPLAAWMDPATEWAKGNYKP